MGKRKQYHDRARHDAGAVGTGETLHRVKRARYSPEERQASDMSSRQQHSNGENHGDDDNNGWQTVVRKGHQRKHQKQSKARSESPVAYPRVYFQQKLDARSPVRLEELRNLVLYVLSNGVGPSWIAVDGRRDMEKVAAVMIPGLDSTMIDRARALLEQEHPSGHVPSNNMVDAGDSNISDRDNETDITNLQDTVHRNAVEHASHVKDLEWLLEGLFSVQAPGDTRQLRVHSPLQAMIMKGHDNQSGRLQNGAQERHFKAVRTPITDFVHTIDELQEAEYPIHPALLTSGPRANFATTEQQETKQVSVDGWIESDVQVSQPDITSVSSTRPHDFLSQGLNIYAIDCEMVLTSDEKSSLARISVISWPDGKVVLDRYVKPSLPITNYFTQYSGITEKILEDVTTTLSDIQNELQKLLTASTIILGHSLESDLNALKMTHPFIIDTSMIYPHPRGLPLRSSLKFLANKYLKREIQKGGVDGHDSVEDARAVLDLVKLKCEKGSLWGTNEANGETIFKKLSLTKVSKVDRDGIARTSAIVEYGTPERGFGKDATYAIGCQNDDEVVKGISRCAHGDSQDGDIPQPGVNFIWARLRALELARGWFTNNQRTGSNSSTAGPATSNTDPVAVAEDNSRNRNPLPPTTEITHTAETDAALLQTLSRINKIRQSLPPKSLLILCSGTSDMRVVSHYQAIQAQYRREFKVKKWDQLTVRWTDVEEQELRKAVEKARMGWGWVGVL